MNVKKVSAKLLQDTGLLFEINRRILHPFGLALEVYVVSDDEGPGEFVLSIEGKSGQRRDVFKADVALGEVWDYREDPDGMRFGDAELEAGTKKLKVFMEEFGNDKLRQRKEVLGYEVQGDE